MNTRQRVRSDVQLFSLQQPVWSQSLAKVHHDLQRMTGAPLRHILKKKPRLFEESSANSGLKSYRKGRSSKLSELVSAVLGFASFLNELDTIDISVVEPCKQSPTKKKPARRPRAEPKKLKALLPKNSALPPFLVAHAHNAPALPTSLLQSISQNTALSRLQYVVRTQQELPRSAAHIKIAKLVQAANFR